MTAAVWMACWTGWDIISAPIRSAAPASSTACRNKLGTLKPERGSGGGGITTLKMLWSETVRLCASVVEDASAGVSGSDFFLSPGKGHSQTSLFGHRQSLGKASATSVQS